MAAATVYVTLDLQLVRHISAARTGVLLLPMAAGLALGAAGGSLILARARSVRPSILLSTTLATAALGGLALTGTGTPIAVLLALLMLLGLGVGFGIGNEMILVQQTVQRRDLGTATTGYVLPRRWAPRSRPRRSPRCSRPAPPVASSARPT